MPAQPAPATLAALALEVGDQRVPTAKPWDRHEEVATGVADQPFHFAFVVALARSLEAIVEQVVRLELAEDSRPLARAVPEDPRHRQLGVVVDDAPRHAAEVPERRVVPVAERLRRLGGKRLHEPVVAMLEIDDQIVRLALDASDHHQRFTEIGLCVARRMGQWHEHLLPAQPLLAHVGFHDRVAAHEAVLRA